MGKEIKNVLLEKKPDRRLLPRMRDAQNKHDDPRGRKERRNKLRRGIMSPSLPEHRGQRYASNLDVKIKCTGRKCPVKSWTTKTEDISTSGMLLLPQSAEKKISLENAKRITLRFRIKPGDMPEGYEMRVKTKAKLIASYPANTHTFKSSLAFNTSLVNYAYKRKGRNFRFFALISLLLFSFIVVQMRVEGAQFFQFNRLIYIYSIVTAAYLLSRYLFALFYRPTPVNPDFEPAVSIIIPCYNEEEWIQRTILGCLDQEYPPEKVEVIVVDDCSSDGSREKIRELIQMLAKEEDPSHPVQRLHFLLQEKNMGKREAMVRGARLAKHEMLVFVDSDSFLDPTAIRHLVQPFQDPKVGGSTGRTDVANTYTNFITKMQSVRYYVSFRVMKAAEGYFDAVTCLSGPLSCYRKSLLLQYADEWLTQTFLGQKATFGDDRSMTNFILRNHRTTYQDSAVCSTIVPNTHKIFLRQQMRWKRSWLRESAIAATFMWKKEPLMALSFYFGFLIPILSPAIVIYNLLYVPIVFHYFPRTFLIGLFAMAMLMSMTQLLLRRNRTWIYGLFFCLYHILILIWQMPIAWVTFWKSNWGTRETPQDEGIHSNAVPFDNMKAGDPL